MPISGESLPDWPRLPTGKLLQVSTRSKLMALATRLEVSYGSPRSTMAQPESILSSAAAKLAASNGDLGALTHRERKATVELFWGRFGDWEPSAADVRKWLAWAERDWNSRIGVSRVAVSYVRNMDPTAEATKIVGDWLARRIAEIHGPFGGFFRDYALHDGRTAVERISRSLGNGNSEFLSRIAADLRTSVVARGSGLLIALVEAYGNLCAAGAATTEVAAVSRVLLSSFGGSGLGDKGSQKLRDSARVAMSVGIVRWASRRETPEAIELAIESCLSLAGDPRQSMASWRDIPAETLDEVVGWLTERTIENMFAVIDTLKTDRPDQWKARRAFWRSYLPYIKRAYLVCAAHAQPIAQQLKESYGVLATPDPRHCGVLMQLVGPSGDKLIVLEVNKNAAALVWQPGSASAPAFYGQRVYNRQSYFRTCDAKMSHMSGWPKKFSGYIEGQTGIRPPPAVNRIV